MYNFFTLLLWRSVSQLMAHFFCKFSHYCQMYLYYRCSWNQYWIAGKQHRSEITKRHFPMIPNFDFIIFDNHADRLSWLSWGFLKRTFSSHLHPCQNSGDYLFQCSIWMIYKRNLLKHIAIIFLDYCCN